MDSGGKVTELEVVGKELLNAGSKISAIRNDSEITLAFNASVSSEGKLVFFGAKASAGVSVSVKILPSEHTK